MGNKRRHLGGHVLYVAACAVLPVLTAWHTASSTRDTLPRGSEPEAREYYQSFSRDLGFSAQPDVTTVDNLLTFIGYPIPAKVLQSTDSARLMDPRPAGSVEGLDNLDSIGGARFRAGDILITRFFAPKIVNVNVATPVPGWRKLVRLRTRPDSDAAKHGIEAVIILFNFLAPPAPNPFATPSLNTQVMLLTPAASAGLYWLDFKPDNTLGLALNASFDAADLQGGATGPNHDYFVPAGCNGCHGSPDGLLPPMVNYLDTDNWFDRLEDPGFAALKGANVPLLADSRTNDTTDNGFHIAFDVIRQFNEEVLRQNSLAQPTAVETEAARTWLRLHAKTDDHRLPAERALSLGGTAKWQASEAEGLSQLNRYCFRCHGTVRFSVFDRGSVVERALDMRSRLAPDPGTQTSFKMPPDRVLSPAEIRSLDDFLRTVK
jgi:hypothetical protein